MSFRGKLLLAQLPLVLALIASTVMGGLIARESGRSTERILEANYRSVLAAQQMKESVVQLDDAALFLVAGRGDLAAGTFATHRARFEAELRVQEGNVTESGEGDATARLRRVWTDFSALVGRFDALAEAERRDLYFSQMRPAFTAVKEAADGILALNQDAMVRKSARASRDALRAETILVVVSLFGFALGLFASTKLTTRVLRPLSVLGQAARRIGEGDLVARAQVQGRDEIAQLATEFNTMAERIQKYRESSLGELLEAQRAAQAAIDSLPDPVIVLSVEGHLLHVNRAAETMLGVGVEAPGNPLAELDPAVRAAVDRVHAHVTSGKGAYLPRGLEEAVRLATPEGERSLVPRATPVYSEEGGVVGTTILLQDVTRLLRFEELRNNLVATVAHEFRTPLTSLRMAIHLLTEQTVGSLTDKQADLVYAAREDCERLQGIVEELLDLSRIQAGRIELRRAPVEVEGLVRTALDAQRGIAGQHQVQLRAEVLPGIGLVSVDPDRIQLAFANLLSNAIRHSPAGSAVTLRAATPDGWVRFEVADHGPGIPKELHQAIFEKYFQVPGTSATGAGLGLFIAKEIVHAHGGEIGVESEPGKGSVFWFKLPAKGGG